MINEVTIQPIPTFEKMHWTLDVMIALLPDFQVFKNQTTMFGVHYSTDIPFLHSILQLHIDLRQGLYNNQHIGLDRVDGVKRIELKFAMLHEYDNRIKTLRTNLCNLIFSEN